MAEGGVDLIQLADGENSFEVRILGRTMPGVLERHDVLDAEIIVTSEFAQGRLGVCLTPDDLDGWSRVLGKLAAGQDAVWMDDGRNPEILFELADHDGVAVVVVTDAAGSGTSVRVPVRLADNWADDQYERLRGVRATWPQEVVETSFGVYQWRR